MTRIRPAAREPIATHVYELMLKPADKNNDGKLSKTELSNFKQYIASNKHSNSGVQQRREAAIGDLIENFSLFDQDGNGGVDRTEIRDVASTDKRGWDMSAKDLEGSSSTDNSEKKWYEKTDKLEDASKKSSGMGGMMEMLLPLLLMMLLGGGLGNGFGNGFGNGLGGDRKNSLF